MFVCNQVFTKTFTTPQGKETRITWQPQPGVRQAIVIERMQPAKNGASFVVSGRSLKEVESREAQLTWMVGIGWIAILIATFLATLSAGVILPSTKY